MRLFSCNNYPTSLAKNKTTEKQCSHAALKNHLHRSPPNNTRGMEESRTLSLPMPGTFGKVLTWNRATKSSLPGVWPSGLEVVNASRGKESPERLCVSASLQIAHAAQTGGQKEMESEEKPFCPLGHYSFWHRCTKTLAGPAWCGDGHLASGTWQI